ncbi:MAG: hypothetical protein LAP21_21475 [Acidobacteriia bacterium]|nr:hypothetical protein [Terriglobia bacterium]
MKNNLNKLMLHQETLRNLTGVEVNKNAKPTANSCVKSVCFPICTPAAGIQ